MPNETKKIKKLLKEYFIFSTGERKGILWLLAILILLISAPFFYEWIFPNPPLPIQISELQKLDEDHPTFTSNYSNEHTETLFQFDPNTATDKELSELGFSNFNIKTIKNYLSKGGKFRKPDDVKKIFGIKEEFYNKIEPFIVINSAQKNFTAFSDSTKSKKAITKKVVEINTADSVELVGLYRIGPATAARIIDYRNKLGGFLKIEQLSEIWGFDEDVLYDLNGKITVDASKAKIYDVNMVTADELKTHPYFKYKISNAIVNYRRQHGNYLKLDDLKNIVLINDSVYKRITLYLKLN
jgi:DNA uptake protein ComE-like DNA-binding protein